MRTPVHTPRFSWSRFFLVALSASLLGGCSSMPTLGSHHTAGPAYAPRNYSGEPVMPLGIHRVLLLPLAGGGITDPDTVATMDPTLHTALQRQARFEVVTLSRNDCRNLFQAPEYSSAAALPNGFMEKLGRIYAVEAIMFVDLTVYRPYRPLELGFRAKLATVKDVRLVWTFDETFSASDPALAAAVQRSAADHGDTTTPSELAPKVLQSPGRLAAFAADAMFKTLPPR
ncbi:MAG TPA: hypothetical protein VHD32_02490 [Candidatus Didemnitutus sp.]|nr:hypothetical protein [Candidatus Didemnitutus sp.]